MEPDETSDSEIPKPLFNSTAVANELRPSEEQALNLSPICKKRYVGYGRTHLSNSQQHNEKSGDENEESGMHEQQMDDDFCKKSHAALAIASSSGTQSHTITNPFESDLVESLSATTYSPNLFKMRTPTRGSAESSPSSFRWSIGQMAELYPVNIDESQVIHQVSTDPVFEAQAHSAIDKFWGTQKYVMPSPQLDSLGKKMLKARHHRREQLLPQSPIAVLKRHVRKEVRQEMQRRAVTSVVQTTLTIPPDVDLHELLGDQFRYAESDVKIEETKESPETSPLKRLTSGVDRPSWYHSEDEAEMPSMMRRLSFGLHAYDDEGKPMRLFSPEISPIKQNKCDDDDL